MTDTRTTWTEPPGHSPLPDKVEHMPCLDSSSQFEQGERVEHQEHAFREQIEYLTHSLHVYTERADYLEHALQVQVERDVKEKQDLEMRYGDEINKIREAHTLDINAFQRVMAPQFTDTRVIQERCDIVLQKQKSLLADQMDCIHGLHEELRKVTYSHKEILNEVQLRASDAEREAIDLYAIITELKEQLKMAQEHTALRPSNELRKSMVSSQSMTPREFDTVAMSAPRDSAPRDSAPRDSAFRDSAPRESAPRKSAPRDSAPRDSAPRDSAVRESAPHDSAFCDSASNESDFCESVGERSYVDTLADAMKFLEQ
jgi:hypothetical protein